MTLCLHIILNSWFKHLCNLPIEAVQLWYAQNAMNYLILQCLELFISTVQSQEYMALVTFH